MSTELRNIIPKIYQTRFWGGEERGTCVQLTQIDQGVGYIQLTRQEAAIVAAELLLFATNNEVEE